jgi:hypothetical protein
MMKVLILAIAATLSAFSQSKVITPGQATDCNRMVVGSRAKGTVSMTCRNIDAKLADVISQLVTESRQGKDIAGKLDALLAELRNPPPPPPPPPTSVFSVTQQGGIADGTIEVNGAPRPVTVAFSQISANQKQTSRDGSEAFVTSVRVSLNGTVPVLQLTASAASLIKVSVLPERDGAATGSRRPAVNGSGGQSIENASGQYVLRLESSAPEQFQIEYSCQGAACGPEARKN